MHRQHYASSPDDLPSAQLRRSMSGLEFMQRMLEGKLPLPPIARLMNFRLHAVEPGRVVFCGSPEFSSTNPMGSVHGGWYGTMLDSAMACAVMTGIRKGQDYTTLEYKVNMIRPVQIGSTVLAEGTVVHGGRSTAVAEARITAGDGKICAKAVTTCLIIG